MTAQAIETVERIVRGWKGAPPVTVVAWPDDLPVKNAPGDVRGLYHRGATWIVDNTQHPSKVGATLAHEALGHHAMRETLGGVWRSFMYALHHGARAGDKPMAAFRQAVERVYVNDDGQCNLSAVNVGDEMAAAVVEARFDSASGRLVIDQPHRKLLQAAVGHTARELLYLDRPATMGELEGVLLRAEHRLRHGGSFYGLGRRLRDWYAPQMPKFDPRQPPMSLRESERLLKAENNRLSEKEASRASWGFIFYGVGGLILFVWGIAAMASGFLDFLRMLFR